MAFPPVDIINIGGETHTHIYIYIYVYVCMHNNIYIYIYIIYVYYVFVKRNDRGTTVQNNHTINRTKLGEADMCFSLW